MPYGIVLVGELVRDPGIFTLVDSFHCCLVLLQHKTARGSAKGFPNLSNDIMGQVKKSIKKFQAKGGKDAAKKANRSRKVESAKRAKRSALIDAKKTRAEAETAALEDTVNGRRATKKKGKDDGEDEVAASVKQLEGMDVGAFMDALGGDSDDEGEEDDDEDNDEDDENEVGDDKEDDKEVEDDDDDENEDEKEDDEDVSSGSDGGSAPVKTKKASLAAHAAELAALEAKDPEFFKFLQQNNKELLDFDPNESDDEEEAGEDGEDGDGALDEDDEDDDEEAAAAAAAGMGGGAAAEAAPQQVIVTLPELRALEKSLGKDHSLRALKKLVDMCVEPWCHIIVLGDCVRVCMCAQERLS